MQTQAPAAIQSPTKNGNPKNESPHKGKWKSPAKKANTSVVLLESPLKFSKATDGNAQTWSAAEKEAMCEMSRRRRSSIAEAIAAADGEQQRRIEQDDINQRVDELHRKANVATANRLEHEEMQRRVSLEEWAQTNAVLLRMKQVEAVKHIVAEEQHQRVLELEINRGVNLMHRRASATMANRLECDERMRRMSEQAACVEESRCTREESIAKAKDLFEVARREAMIERSARTGKPLPSEYNAPGSFISRWIDFVKAWCTAILRQWNGLLM